MGVDLSPIIGDIKRSITLDALNEKKLAIDGYNALYQFITIIRGEDGSPLMDSNGLITSHISGLFYRTLNFLEKGIKPVYVFDGKPPELKAHEISTRRTARNDAIKMYEDAKAQGNQELMKRYSVRAATLKSYMVDDAKRLLGLMGVPWLQAPGEGEAEAAHLTAKGYTWGSVSQDYDSLLFGSPRLLRNITISGKRKLPGKNFYINVSPEMIQIEEMLGNLEINREQLVDLAIIIGTDFNEGIKGIGPKTALKLIKQFGRLENSSDLSSAIPEDLVKQVRNIFLKPDVVDAENLEWKSPDAEGLISFLCGEKSFSEERVKNAIGRLKKRPASGALDEWFT
ncbi:MAG: flap endonuclease-1 [Nitrososphaerota archaeon]|nr:flap endonuclease-1 [Nitrososphaerota archaeon]MDG6927466.1 flap endonuclease-1 [Nitrososphaerota archaeon]MDG6930997.1 flap endonuclease-1 [Nitrososphaerota archaeon]MDG6931529.1 flap endonuclease-1 [Nitrososphaerota archaeon]MDG6936262.1 flap endonuclease-1 [Nitrososphaerota archaeon]